jgi:uroporphyrinogen III methyltransferase/synthase
VADLAAKALEKGLGPPAVLVVGKVVSLRERLEWVKFLPLWGKRILVTRAREQASELAQSLRSLGAQAVEFPTISVEPPSDWSGLDDAIWHLGEYDWLILTSPNGVRFFVDRLFQLGKDCRALRGLLVAAMGTGTARALEQRGVKADLVPQEFRAEALAQALSQQAMAGKRFLLARAEQARDVLPETLRGLGGQVNVVSAYKSVVCQERGSRAQELLREGRLDAVTFTSSSTVTNLAHLLGKEFPELLAGVTVACIGPITASTARQLGLEPQVVASRYTIEGLVEALAAHFRAGKEAS